MSVFPGANNVTITGGNFTAAPTTVANTSSRNDIVALLHSHSATAGLLDAKERFDAPKCDEGTRTSMIHAMKKFVQDGDGASSPALYWLHGPAGVGKSALAQSVSLSLQAEGDHAASFFFSRTSPGRNNGNELIVTLAYQLATNFPALQRFISKAVRKKPAIITASNAAQMQGLIIDPINKWRKRYTWSIQRSIDRLSNVKPHPRLILVDGLDECNNPNVQTDLILCIASAVRQLSIPLRFVVVSRPESHILATYELNLAFQGPNGVPVTKKNLGDDEDADEQITKFLLKEFSEIRRVHPIRNFLPQHWPHPDQIRQLVSKSSRGFIYVATVIRYIRMPHNRPDECLNRILGLSEIPTSDKPYEPLDALYRHIFESLPTANKFSVHHIFHCFVLPHIWDGSTNTATIERHLRYPQGHVQHVLSDLLCLVDLMSDGHIKILHASLPDFLLDKSRSGHLYIDASDVHATAAASYLFNIHLSNELPSPDNGFPDFKFLGHMMEANMSNTLLYLGISQMNLLPQCMDTCNPNFITHYESNLNDPFLRLYANSDTEIKLARQNIRGISFIMAYLLVLVIQRGPEIYIRNQIATIKAYVFELYPAAGDVRVVNERIIPFMTQLFRRWTRLHHGYVKHIFECKVAPSQNELREAIFELYCLMGAQICQQVIEPSNSSKGKGRLQTEHPEQRTRKSPDFWANVVHGIDNSSNITLAELT